MCNYSHPPHLAGLQSHLSFGQFSINLKSKVSRNLLVSHHFADKASNIRTIKNAHFYLLANDLTRLEANQENETMVWSMVKAVWQKCDVVWPKSLIWSGLKRNATRGRRRLKTRDRWSRSVTPAFNTSRCRDFGDLHGRGLCWSNQSGRRRQSSVIGDDLGEAILIMLPTLYYIGVARFRTCVCVMATFYFCLCAQISPRECPRMFAPAVWGHQNFP